MAIIDKNRVEDGARILTGGVNSGRPSNLIAKDQVAWAVNTTFRDGLPQCRPGLINRALRFKAADGTEDATLKANFENGRFQGVIPYDGVGNTKSCFIWSIGGRFFRVSLDTFTVQDITPSKQETMLVRLPFVVPAVGANTNVTLYSVNGLSTQYPVLSINGKQFTLIAVTSVQTITVRNDNDTPATTVPKNATINFTAVDRNANNLWRIWWVQADRFLAIQDGQSRTLIYDGSLLRRAGRDEIPTGKQMAYARGRIWVALPHGYSFIGCDLIYGASGTAAYAYADAVIKNTENPFIISGGQFPVPLNAGGISAMCVIGDTDTSLGQGPLEVFTDKSVFSVDAPTRKEDWLTVTYPIKTTSLIDYGAQAQMSAVPVNGDIWYRAADGFRSFQVARRDFGTWVNTPLSREVTRLLTYDDARQLWAGSGVNFDNRLLMTASPYRSFEHGMVHRGLAVLNFDSVSGLREQDVPAWEGMWTGLQILQIFKATIDRVERCFIAELSSDNTIRLWEQTKEDKFDSVDNLVSWIVEYRGMGCEDDGWYLKELSSGDQWIDRLTGTLEINAFYRPDDYPIWVAWDSGSRCANYLLDDPSGETLPVPKREQYRPRVQFKFPDNGCEEANNKVFRNGFKFNVRLELSGFARLDRFRLNAHKVPEDAHGKCMGTEECQTQEDWGRSDFGYATAL